jgi:beta-mannosidase
VLLSAEDWPPGDDTPDDHIDPEDNGQRRVRWSLEMLDGEVLSTGEQVMSVQAVAQILGGGGQPASVGWKPEASLYLTNDLTDAWQGTVHWSLEALNGQALETGSKAVTVPALSAINVCSLDLAEHVNDANRREVVLVYELRTGNERLSMGVMPFVPNKHLALSDPELTYDVSESDAGFEITITAQRLARFIELALDSTDPSTERPQRSPLRTSVVFGDNYFDLPAGRTVPVQLSALDGWTVERVRESLRVRSLVDSF